MRTKCHGHEVLMQKCAMLETESQQLGRGSSIMVQAPDNVSKPRRGVRRVMTMLIRVSRCRVIERLMTKMTFLMFLD